MDLFQHRYYRVNRMLLKLVGLWPFQSRRVRFIITVVLLFLGVSVIVPQIIAILKHLDDVGFLIECSSSMIFAVFGVNKYFACVINSRKMAKLLNGMRRNWAIWSQDHDVDILHEYSETGRKWTLAYSIATTATFFLFMTQPVLPKIIDIVLKNGSEPGDFPVPIDYLIDEQKYYFYLMLHIGVSASPGYVVSSAYDAMFAVYVYHVCGLFAALGRKLERNGITEISEDTCIIENGLDKSSMDFGHLSSCIEQHNNTIEYAKLMDATYSWSFLVMVGCNMLLISITGIQIFKRTVDPEESLRFIVTNLACMLQLYLNSYMCQMLIDHSSGIRYCLFNIKWYNHSLEAQKLLPVMLMRCNVPCKLTAGKITVMSVESFGMFMKTSLSYFTLLRSV